MSSPDERHVSICLRKYTLNEIENAFAQHLLSIPILDEDNKQQNIRTINELRKALALHAEKKCLLQKKGYAAAMHERLKRENKRIIQIIEKSRDEISELEKLIEQEEMDSRLKMKPYEDTLKRITNESRHYSNIYDEDRTRGEAKKVNEILSASLAENKVAVNDCAELRNTINSMRPETENIFEFMGITKLEEELNYLK